MELPRRHFLRLAAAALGLPAATGIAKAENKAEDYPARPVHFIVPQAAASSSDITARLIGQWLSDHLGQPFIVDNRPGVGGNVGTEAVVRSAPDGYTLLLVNSQNAISPALYSNLSFDFIRDIAPVAWVNSVPLVMEVNPSVPAKTVPEFIAYAKANPGKINMASAGVGGPQHAAGELFKAMAGVNLVHVPYRGSTPAITDLLGGQVQVMFDVMATALPQIKAGKLRALGVTTAKRARRPARRPGHRRISARLRGGGLDRRRRARRHAARDHRHAQQTNQRRLANPAIKTRLTDLGYVVQNGTPVDFGKFIAAETRKWGKVIRDAGIKPE